MWDRNQTRGGRQTPDEVFTGKESRKNESITGLNTVIGGFRIETCSMPLVLHSWPGLQGLPCSEGLFISLQQSIPISFIIAMPSDFIGHGSDGASTPAIPLRGSAKLIMKRMQNRR